MKKLLSILLSIAMVTLLLTGCGKTETTASFGTGRQYAELEKKQTYCFGCRPMQQAVKHWIRNGGQRLWLPGPRKTM